MYKKLGMLLCKLPTTHITHICVCVVEREREKEKEKVFISENLFQDFFYGKSKTQTNLFLVPILDYNTGCWVEAMHFHTSQFCIWRFFSWFWQQQLHCFSLQSRFFPKWDWFWQANRQIHQWQNHSWHCRQVFSSFPFHPN